jgi:transposase InsO family protein
MGLRHRLRTAGLLGSMGRVASSVDNSMIESFWSTMQRELSDQTSWRTPEQLGTAIFEWIEAWYNPRRRHTALDMLSPVAYEQQWQATTSLPTAADGAA